MAPPLHDSRPLPEWFELDYFRRPRRLRSWLRLAPRLTFGVGLALVGLTFWPGSAALYQAAPVSTPHALFNDDCRRCHLDAFLTPRRLLPGNADLHTVSDRACLECHPGGPHHDDQQTLHPGCAGCHREHRGTAALHAVADGHCTNCHADLKRKDGAPARVATVTGFGRDHPDFAVWRQPRATEPERFHFSHQVHLQPDGVADGRGKTVKLSCESCHQPDARRQNFLSVRYERNCAQCHPLAVQLVGSWQAPKVQQAAEKFRQQPAPHRPASEVRAALRERLTRLAEQEPTLFQPHERPGMDRLLPREFDETPPREATASEWVGRQLREVERALFQGAGGCAFCHARKPADQPGNLPEFAATGLAQSASTHTRFRHDSHQILRCTECHPAAESRTASDILLPRIATCQKCHNPKAGARSDCIECHRYHDRSGERDWNGKWTIDECLGSRRHEP